MATKDTINDRYPVLASNEFIDYHAVRDDFGHARRSATLMGHTRLSADPRATFAMSCLERWGVVASEPDGEDSAGRQKLRLLSVTDLVARACDTAEQAFKAFDQRGWLLAIPSYQEMVEAVKNQENKNE